MESQLLALEPGTNRAHLLILAKIPALGYETYFVRAAAKPAANGSVVKSSTDAMKNDTLENEFLRVKVDPQTGCLTSLFDKQNQNEALAPAETDAGGPTTFTCGNLLQAFYDKPKQWDAWNIDADFREAALGSGQSRRGEADRKWAVARCYPRTKTFPELSIRARYHHVRGCCRESMSKCRRTGTRNTFC